MKLSKEDLRFALWRTMHADSDDDVFFKAMCALDAKTLEIEGYVRADHIADVSKKVDEWTKFDPDNPATFPPVGLYLYIEKVDEYSGLERMRIGFRVHGDDKLFLDTSYFEIKYWRPLPKPPTETEAGNEAE